MRISLKLSPSILNPSVTVTIMMPGKVTSHHAWRSIRRRTQSNPENPTVTNLLKGACPRPGMQPKTSGILAGWTPVGNPESAQALSQPCGAGPGQEKVVTSGGNG